MPENADPMSALRELQSVLNGILSDGPLMDTLAGEGPWWTPPDPTGVRLHDAIIAAGKAVDASLAPETDRDAELAQIGDVLAHYADRIAAGDTYAAARSIARLRAPSLEGARHPEAEETK